jgi:hypothetical protein
VNYWITRSIASSASLPKDLDSVSSRLNAIAS